MKKKIIKKHKQMCTKSTFSDTDHCWETFLYAGSWWWASLSKPCPNRSWHCGAGAAPGPAGRTPPTPSHAGIVQHPGTSPSSSLSSPYWRQVVGQLLLVVTPVCPQEELTSLLLGCVQSESGQLLTATSCCPGCCLTYLHKWLVATVLLAADQGLHLLRVIGWKAGVGSIVCPLVHSQTIV